MNAGSLVVVLGLVLAGCAGVQRPGGMADIIAPGTEVQLAREGFEFIEGPLDMPDTGLLFTELGKVTRIYRLDPHGNLTVFREGTNRSNGLAWSLKGELLHAEGMGGRISRTAPDGSVVEVTRGDGNRPLVAQKRRYGRSEVRVSDAPF